MSYCLRTRSFSSRGRSGVDNPYIFSRWPRRCGRVKAGYTRSRIIEICMLNLPKSFIWAPGNVTAVPRTALKRRVHARGGLLFLSVPLPPPPSLLLSTTCLFIFRRCLNYRKIEPSIFPRSQRRRPLFPCSSTYAFLRVRVAEINCHFK